MALIIGNMLSNEKAVKILVNFAKAKLEFNLDQSQILATIEKEKSNFDQKQTDILINKVFISKIELKQLENKIKIVTQRIKEILTQKQLLTTHVSLTTKTLAQY